MARNLLGKSGKCTRKKCATEASFPSESGFVVDLAWSCGRPILIPDPTPLRRLAISAISSLPVEAGVYFLWDLQGNLVYVGQTTCLRTRLVEHRRRKAAHFEFVSWILEPRAINRLILETIYIVIVRPPLNRAIMLRVSNGDLKEIRWKHGK